MPPELLPPAPSPGEIVRVRQRQYIVEDALPPSQPGDATAVSMTCLDDDSQGESLEVLWEQEIDTEVVRASWDWLGRRDFDTPGRFAAYLHALRWNCVTATNPSLFQSPWRAGIEVLPYQLEPLRKALLMPRVNLFIADDVGLGKTIEAGLILREMLMRQRVRRVVVAAPSSVVLQWRDELEERFGLTFVIYDRGYVARCRRERGYSVNPWAAHSRFIISHALLCDEEYAAPLRDLLSVDDAGKGRDGADPGSLLILDEAHHAAPARSSKCAVDSQFTRVLRDLAEHFEHRLFLSATPDNGLANSFSALLEILDPQRFARGIPVVAKLRDEVIVRRLKRDLAAVANDFPRRHVVKVSLVDLPAAAPELELARLLDEYWGAREMRFAGMLQHKRAAEGLVLAKLQKRLLSSIEAFHRAIKAHLLGIEREAEGPGSPPNPALLEPLSMRHEMEDDRSELGEEEVEVEEEREIEATTIAGGGKPSAREVELVKRMYGLSERSRHLPDARVRWLLDWIRREMCPRLAPLDKDASGSPAEWLARRVVIFTEYADTKRYLERQLRDAIGDTDRCGARLATLHGGMSDDRREEVKRAFNSDPEAHPLRILIATDAAREGVNLQNHCSDLFHFDLPWNPSRFEQRNGRIDRKLQRAQDVRCHYFVYVQREADRVLEVLVECTNAIIEELGSVPPALEERMANRLVGGFVPRGRRQLAEVLKADAANAKRDATPEELDGARERQGSLNEQIDRLQRILSESRESLDLKEGQLCGVLSESLGMIGADGLKRVSGRAVESYEVPALDRRPGADPTWADTLDTLRSPRPYGMKIWDWRRAAPIRPVVFKDPGCIDDSVVHLHLAHRFAQRLLRIFLAQGYALDDLARACVVQTHDPVPRVLLLGRLSLYGERASRLHDEIVSVAARWVAPDVRIGGLEPFAEDGQRISWDLLLDSLSGFADVEVPSVVRATMLRSAPSDVKELLGHLEARCELLASKAIATLRERGEREARDMVEILEGQRARMERELAKFEASQAGFEFADFNVDEQRQLRDNARYWRRRLDGIPNELAGEPDRIRKGYAVRVRRIEPVGIAYLSSPVPGP